MAKKLSTLLIMLFVFAGISFAQSAKTADAGGNFGDGNGISSSNNKTNYSTSSALGTAKITVYNSISATNLNGQGSGLDFGAVAPGVTASISASSSKAAAFGFEGQSGAGVNITVPQSISLKDGNNPSLTVTNISVIHNTTDSQTGAASGTGSNLSSDGNLYIWIGGKVKVPQNQPKGTYSNTFNVSVAYTAD